MLINANALHIPLADGSVHTIVTSPPYYGLRDYGVNGQIGLEVTPDAYIANLVEVFRECKRILRDDGTLWVNIGDSYASVHTGGHKSDKSTVGANQPGIQEIKQSKGKPQSYGVKDKDLIGIPWMLAFALRADGWYLRSDIIWAKPNPMPESVKDRCTKSHEYIFLLSKSKKYYYDNEAIMEKSTSPKETANRYKYQFMTGEKHTSGGYSANGAKHTAGYKNLAYDGQQPNTMHLNRLEGEEYLSPVRNKRDVWTVTTKPYKGAHYATFNPELIKPCILAGAPETCCAKCGAPYERVTEKRDAEYQNPRAFAKKGNADRNDTGEIYKEMVTVTTGFQPTCTCDAGTTRGIVFDPFVGSGTTVATAIQLGRKGIGLDLSMKYLLDNAKERIMGAKMPLFEMEWE